MVKVTQNGKEKDITEITLSEIIIKAIAEIIDN